jgi:DNA replication protein DnaC
MADCDEAHAGRHRRAGNRRHRPRPAARPHLHEPHDQALPAFKDFYGMEDTIERIVGFFRHAAQGLEERKQILYLLGPVGGGKSSLAER